VISPLDSSKDILVQEIEGPVWAEIKDKTETYPYSLYRSSKVHKKFLGNDTFVVDITSWSAYQHLPFCKVKSRIGSIT
jgi:hypothetical protein